jgi:nucleoside-diphosphate-sugar epimerase
MRVALIGVDEWYRGLDAVAHPPRRASQPGVAGNAATLTNNVPATYHVFAAARLAGIRNMVWASSETVIGVLARQAARRAACRPVLPLGPRAEDRRAAVLQHDGADGLQAVRLALAHDQPGFEVFIIANADTVMSRSTHELLAEVYPDVPHKRAFGPHETLLSIEKAKRVLGYAPRHTWR